MATNEELHQDPTAEMLRRLTDQTSTLIRQEMELARVELQEAPSPAAPRRSSGPTALFGLGATGAFVAGVILALATVIEAWIAAFAVALVLAVVAVAAAAAERARDGQPADIPQAEEEAEEPRKVAPVSPIQEFEPVGEGIEVYARENDFRA